MTKHGFPAIHVGIENILENAIVFLKATPKTGHRHKLGTYFLTGLCDLIKAEERKRHLKQKYERCNSLILSNFFRFRTWYIILLVRCTSPTQ